MKLIGNLKKKVENTKTKEEARDTIKKAGMLLDEDELEEVSGGSGGLDYIYSNTLYYIERKKCNRCGKCVEKCESGGVTRMKSGICIINDHCDGCGKCQGVCPFGAIHPRFNK